MKGLVGLLLAMAVAWTAPALGQDNGTQAETQASEETTPPPRNALNELLEQFPAFGFDYLKAEPAEPFDTSKPVVGIGYSKNGSDMQVAQVVPGSAAEAAGMTTGTVVRRINGVRVDEYSLEEIAKLLSAIDGEITFEMESGKQHRLTKAPIPPQAAEGG